MSTKKRYVMEQKGSNPPAYYTVYGWTPGTTTSLHMAVVFPDNLLALPQDRTNWTRRYVVQHPPGESWHLAKKK